MTAFELKSAFSGLYKIINNIEGLKSYLKESPVCLEYNQPKNKTEKILLVTSWSFLHFLKLCSKFLGEKRIHNIFQIRGEKTKRLQDSFKTKLNMSILV